MIDRTFDSVGEIRNIHHDFAYGMWQFIRKRLSEQNAPLQQRPVTIEDLVRSMPFYVITHKNWQLLYYTHPFLIPDKH